MGTLVNCIAIIVGSLLGVTVGKRIENRFQEIAMKATGLSVMLIGLQMAFKPANTLIVLSSLITGALIGEWLDIETALARVGERLKAKLKSKNDTFVEGFVMASALYCVGSMAILGSIEDGLRGNPSILYAKAILDGVTAIAFSSTMGLGVLFSFIPVLVYQGSITLLAASLGDFASEVMMNHLTATGGLMILAIGINITEIGKIRVGNLLPGLFIAVFLAWIFV